MFLQITGGKDSNRTNEIISGTIPVNLLTGGSGGVDPRETQRKEEKKLMRKGLLILAMVGFFFMATPAFAYISCDDEAGWFSAGIGGGFAENDVAPFIISAKYWDLDWEVGGEMLFDRIEESNEYDQIGVAWLIYRYDVAVDEGGATYVGAGAAGLFSDFAGQFGNQFGPVGALGWDSDGWGLELKYAWFDPGVATVCVYYHFE